MNGLLLVYLLAFPAVVTAQTSDLLEDAQSSDVLKKGTDAVSDSLPAVLQSQLGIDEEQAEGGMGSLLSLAGENLGSADFDKLKGLIPGASGYIDKAKNLGAVTGPLKNVAGLNGALGRLGISPEAAGKFVPTVTNYLGKLGGEDATKLLQKALGTA